jgi:hypothetical protein
MRKTRWFRTKIIRVRWRESNDREPQGRSQVEERNNLFMSRICKITSLSQRITVIRIIDGHN